MTDYEKMIDGMLEQDDEEGPPGAFQVKKPFPMRAEPSGRTIPGTIVSRGTPWTIILYAEDAPVPWEMFKVMDLHSRAADKPGFIGWIGGTKTTGRKDPSSDRPLYGALFVDEAQSDLMQRTVEFADPKKYRMQLMQKMADTSAEYREMVAELEQLKREYTGSRAYHPLKRGYEIEQRIGELEQEVEVFTARWKREFKHPEYNEFKSKLENYYKKWVQAFFNAALEYAKKEEMTFLAIISTDKIKSVWHGNLAGKDATLFDRIYDGTAQKWGMERKGDWWIGTVKDIQPLESKTEGESLVTESDEQEGEEPEVHYWVMTVPEHKLQAIRNMLISQDVTIVSECPVPDGDYQLQVETTITQEVLEEIAQDLGLREDQYSVRLVS